MSRAKQPIATRHKIVYSDAAVVRGSFKLTRSEVFSVNAKLLLEIESDGRPVATRTFFIQSKTGSNGPRKIDFTADEATASDSIDTDVATQAALNPPRAEVRLLSALMKSWALLLVVAACHKDDPRCATFADRVVECVLHPSIKPALSDDEKRDVRQAAYAACAKTTSDEATLRYYGDVDRKIACMAGKDCAGVRECLVADDRGSAKPR